MTKVLKIFPGVCYDKDKMLPFLNTVIFKYETAFETSCWGDSSGREEGRSLHLGNMSISKLSVQWSSLLFKHLFSNTENY